MQFTNADGLGGGAGSAAGSLQSALGCDVSAATSRLGGFLGAADAGASIGAVPFVCLVPVAILHNAPWLAVPAASLEATVAGSGTALVLVIPEVLALLAGIVVCARVLAPAGRRPPGYLWDAIPQMLLAGLLGCLWLLVLVQPWSGPGRPISAGGLSMVAVGALPLCAALGGFPLYGLPRFFLRLAGRAQQPRLVAIAWLSVTTAVGYALVHPACIPAWFDSFGLGGEAQDGIKVLMIGAIMALFGSIVLWVHVRAEAPVLPGDREGDD